MSLRHGHKKPRQTYGNGSRQSWQHCGKLRTTHCTLRCRPPVIKHFAAELAGTTIHTSRRTPPLLFTAADAALHRHGHTTPLQPAHQCISPTPPPHALSYAKNGVRRRLIVVVAAATDVAPRSLIHVVSITMMYRYGVATSYYYCG